MRFAGALVVLAAFVTGAIVATLVIGWLVEKARSFVDARRRRPKRGIVFTLAFSAYTIALVAWLVAGLGASFVRASPSLHHRLHAHDHATRTTLAADHYSFDRAQLTVPAGRPVTILFRNKDTDVEHNLAIYENVDATEDNEFIGEVRIAASKGYVGPTLREVTFAPLEPGFYSFQCDVEDPDSEIGNHARYMTGFLTVEPAPAVRFDTGFTATAKRGLASAYHHAEGPGGVALDYVFSVLALGLGLYLVAKRHLDRVARFFGVGMIGTAAAYNIQSHAALEVIPSLGNIVHPMFVHFVSGIAYIYAVVLFPDGKLVPSFSRSIPRAAYRALLFIGIVFAVAAAGLAEPTPGHGHAAAFVQAFGILVPGVGVIAQSYRYRHARSPETKQQSKILLWAFVPALVLGVAVLAIRAIAGPASGFTGPQETELETLAFRVFQPVFIVIPIAIIVGILRYRMWELDVVINKAILYGTLAAFIGAVYVGVVTGAGRAFGAAGNPALGLTATIIVAVAFGPLRRRVQRFANLLVYGRRATPYEALAEFSRSLAATLPAEDVLPRMAETAARGIGAAGAHISVVLPAGGTRTVTWPPDRPPVRAGAEHTREIVHAGTVVGTITVTKAPGDPMTARDERILDALADQAGVALEGVRLTEQLHERLSVLSAQAKQLALSRMRIVTAAATERRRVQQEIERGVERELDAVRKGLARARRASAKDTSRAAESLDDLADRANAALDTLRDIARGLFPPLLADKGVPAALDAQMRKLASPVAATFDDAFCDARFDAEAETVLYFCCVEGLRATAGTEGRRVSLDVTRRDGWIDFSIRDAAAPANRAALDEAVERMTDRVEALGGSLVARADESGTELSGRVPVTSGAA